MNQRKSSPVRLAIIGTGGMAHTHVRFFREAGGCTIVAAADIAPPRVAAFCAKHEIPAVFTSVAQLLAQPDFARGAEVQRVLDACFKSNALGRPVKV